MTERELKNQKQREYRAKNKNKCTKSYEKTKSGFIMRMYRNMKTRINNKTQSKTQRYNGLDILSKEEFYLWINNNSVFHTLFEQYEESNFQMRLAPSIDRVDSNKGYTLDNIRIITHSINSILANNNKRVRFLIESENKIVLGYEGLAKHLDKSYHQVFYAVKNNKLNNVVKL